MSLLPPSPLRCCGTGGWCWSGTDAGAGAVGTAKGISTSIPRSSSDGPGKFCAGSSTCTATLLPSSTATSSLTTSSLTAARALSRLVILDWRRCCEREQRHRACLVTFPLPPTEGTSVKSLFRAPCTDLLRSDDNSIYCGAFALYKKANSLCRNRQSSAFFCNCSTSALFDRCLLHEQALQSLWRQSCMMKSMTTEWMYTPLECVSWSWRLWNTHMQSAAMQLRSTGRCLRCAASPLMPFNVLAPLLITMPDANTTRGTV